MKEYEKDTNYTSDRKERNSKTKIRRIRKILTKPQIVIRDKQL